MKQVAKSLIRAGLITYLGTFVGCGDTSPDSEPAASSEPAVSFDSAPASSPALASALAEDQNPTSEEVTLRPGDKITWTPTNPHRVRFGGTITVNDAEVRLTSFSDVQKVLKDFNPQLTVDAEGIALGPPGGKVTATVREEADQSGVSSFFFTCGFPPHRVAMVTTDFLIAPGSGNNHARDVQIRSSNNPLAWMLRGADGDRPLTRP